MGDRRNVGIHSAQIAQPRGLLLGQIYFPPLVWQLVQREQMSLLVEQRWVDVSSWLAYPPDHSARFVDLVSSLSVVKHPCHDPRIANDWSELLHDESCFMVESENATRREWIG